MRRAGLTDLDLLARHLLTVPEDARPCRARQICERAHLFDRARRRLRKALPGAGDGSLATEALRAGIAPSGRCGPRYVAALGIAAAALAAWQADPARRSRRRAGRQPSRACN